MNRFIKRLLCTALAGIILLSAAGCGSDGTEGKDSTTPAETESIEEFNEMLSSLDTNDAAAVEKAVTDYLALSQNGKNAAGYSAYEKITSAAYALVNSGKLADIDTHRQDVIAAVALAYYNQSYASRQSAKSKPQTQYDQYNNRRNFNANPEDATDDRILYLDCSSFVNSVYYYTFGRNIREQGKSVTTKYINDDMSKAEVGADKELMYYITGTELSELKSDTSKAAALIDEIKSVLQPGDIINYYRESSGHVIMYLGDGKFIHSIGTANKKTTNADTNPRLSVEAASSDERRYGTIEIDEWGMFFGTSVTAASQKDGRTGTSNRYLFSSNVTAIAIFRPTNANNGSMRSSALSEASINRYLYQGLDIEKTATTGGTSLYYGNSVQTGDEITYTVAITNFSDSEIKAVSAVENIPEGLEYVSSCESSAYFKDENKVCMYIPTLAAGETVNFTYTLKVTAAGGTVIDDGDTFVNSIRTNRLINQVDAKTTGSTAMLAAISSFLGKDCTDVAVTAAEIYSSLGYTAAVEELRTLGSVQGVIEKYLPSNLFDAGAAKLAVRTFYGGYKVGSATISKANKELDYTELNLRLRRIMMKNLENGDIICTYTAFTDTSLYTGYIYFEGELYGLSADGKTFSKVSFSRASSGTTLQDYLDTLTAYNQFIILRPSLAG